MAKHILLVGGGSGGHVYPLIAVAQALKELAEQKNRRVHLQMMGNGSFLAEAAQSYGIPYINIMSGKLRRYASGQTIVDILKLPLGMIQALWHMYWMMPDVIFAKGGHASVLPVLAARFFFIPVYLHETDSVPGLANRIMAARAKKIFISFASSQESFGTKRTELVGNPVRKDIFGANRESALRSYNLDGNKKTILVTGGSQGAQPLNNAVLSGLVQLVQSGFQIIHQCGEGQIASVQSEIDNFIKEGQEKGYGELIKNQYRLQGFFNAQDLANAYSVADVVISRAGGIIFELAMLGKPVILVPLPHAASDHQLKNALEFANSGAILIEEQNLTPHILLNTIQSVLDPQVYGSICQKIKSFAKPDAAHQIASALL